MTNDPGTPGNANWEINLGAYPVMRNSDTSVEFLQFDINYGLGERIQLTYEVPLSWQSGGGLPNATGWGNAYAGVKWRFISHGEDGWNVSTFPQFELPGSQSAVRQGLAAPGTRLLVPVEVNKKLGPLHLDLEAGYFFPFNSSQGRNERILGLALGRQVTKNLEAIGEVYNDKVMGVSPADTTFDAGARWHFHRGFVLLFMAGRSFSSNSSGQPNFLAYGGIQILLSHYGTRLESEP